MNSFATPHLLLESIRLDNGEWPLLPIHQERIDRSRRLLLGADKKLDLRRALREVDFPDNGIYKVRILYRDQIEQVTWEPYRYREVKALKLLDVTGLDYRLKYADRSALETAFAQRGQADDVLLTWQGFITDTSYANVALYDGKHWWTPGHPLLRGVRRCSLLRENLIRPINIRATDLPQFKCLRLINAMLNLADSPDIDVQHIRS